MEGHVAKEKDLEGHLDQRDRAGDAGRGAARRTFETRDRTEDESEPEALEAQSDEEDFQLQRALDLLKTWDIFHKNQGAATAKAD